VDWKKKPTFSCIFAFTKNTAIDKMCPKWIVSKAERNVDRGLVTPEK